MEGGTFHGIFLSIQIATSSIEHEFKQFVVNIMANNEYNNKDLMNDTIIHQ